MNKNVITQFESSEIKKIVEPILQNMDLAELTIKNYEEFFHALIHVKPKLFLVEIDTEYNPYLKIIKIMKKSIVTKDVPIMVITSSTDRKLLDLISSLDIESLVYPPLHESIIKLYVTNTMNTMTCKESAQVHQDLQTVQSVMISSLASLAEYRDPETGEHIKRTQNYVKALATTLRRKGFFTEELTIENIEAMYMSVPLHDIGKVGIRDEILLKPGRLTDDEFEIMKTHALLGYEAIMKVGNKLKNNTFLEYAADVAYTHHEKYDGSGYPRGLKGDDIPLIGRLMAVADVYDALTSKRVYKEAMSHDEAMTIIKNGIGKHFDPTIVECALSLESTFQNISHTYKDKTSEDSTFTQLVDLYESGLLKKILVVEDSRIVREITRNQLQALGFEVDEAFNGIEGYKAVEKNDYDMVLLDIEMPKMNGYKMASKIRLGNKRPIMIAMTAADYNITVEELQDYGISGLILKPLDFNRLATLFLEAKRSEQEG